MMMINLVKLLTLELGLTSKLAMLVGQEVGLNDLQRSPLAKIFL